MKNAKKDDNDNIIANAGPLNWPHHPIKSFSAHKSILPFLKDLNIPAKKQNEPRHDKTCFLHMRKQRCRSAHSDVQ